MNRRSPLIVLLLALMLVYLVMASLFESLTQPFALLFAIPFALPGTVRIRVEVPDRSVARELLRLGLQPEEAGGREDRPWIEYRVPVERVVSCGGIAEKNSLFMQIYADVLG